MISRTAVIAVLALVALPSVGVAQDHSPDRSGPPSGQPLPPAPGPEAQPPGPVGGPPGGQPRPRRKCLCKKVDAHLTRPNVTAYFRKHVTFWFTLHLAMLCDEGDDPDCVGEGSVSTATNGVSIPEAGKPLVCRGKKCNEVVKAQRDIHVRVDKTKLYRKTPFRAKIKVTLRCRDGAWRKRTITLVFRNGVFDRAASDLNGDGKPDGK